MIVADRLKGRKTLKVGEFLDEFEKDDIKKDVDIVGLFRHFGVELTKKGKSHVARCPWHDDKNPSLSVDQGKGLYNCFGCGESGDIFTLTEKMKGFSFRESVDYLKEFSGGVSVQNEKVTPLSLAASRTRDGIENSVSAGDKESGTDENSERDAEPGKAQTKEDNADEGVPQAAVSPAPEITLTTLADYYHKRLFDSEEALQYLKKR